MNVFQAFVFAAIYLLLVFYILYLLADKDLAKILREHDRAELEYLHEHCIQLHNDNELLRDIVIEMRKQDDGVS